MSPRQGDKVSQHFVELPSTDDAKCVRVQCLHCNSVKAKNTTRQKEHLRSCKPYLLTHPEAAFEDVDDDDATTIGGIGNNPPPLGSGQYPPGIGMGGHGNTNVSFAPNPRINGANMHLAVQVADSSEGPARKKHKAVKQPKQSNAATTENELPLVNVHAAYEEFKKPNDKCFTVRCRFCGQTRAKNTSRQRDHLKNCAEYLLTLPEEPSIPGVNNVLGLNHIIPQQQRPTPALTFDFRLSLKFRQPLNVGTVFRGHEQWNTVVGGHWSGLPGKGNVVSGTETLLTPNNPLVQATIEINSKAVIQTGEQPPAYIKCMIHGHKLDDGTSRVTIKMETGDARYGDLNNGVWVASGSSRGQETAYDAYRVG